MRLILHAVPTVMFSKISKEPDGKVINSNEPMRGE